VGKSKKRRRGQIGGRPPSRKESTTVPGEGGGTGPRKKGELKIQRKERKNLPERVLRSGKKYAGGRLRKAREIWKNGPLEEDYSQES